MTDIRNFIFQQKSQIELKFYSQLKDKHLKLKQSLKQQHSLLNIVGNQLKLGWETVLSHDQQRMHQQLIKKLSDMGVSSFNIDVSFKIIDFM